MTDPHALDLLCQRLAGTAGDVESAGAWPAEQLGWMNSAGVMGWILPLEVGGAAISNVEMTERYIRLSQACLTTTFILTQRNGACQRIAASPNAELRAELLPGLLSGDLFATVGISHLSTSRQYLGKPSVEARLDGGRIQLNGYVPWVTGGAQANFIVTGGTLEDGTQILAAVPRGTVGVRVHAPQPLLALSASQTGAISLDAVEFDARYLVAGPAPHIMQQSSGGAGSLTTSALAVGVSAAALELLAGEANRRPELQEPTTALLAEAAELRSDLLEAAAGERAPDARLAPNAIRARANSLALRTTQAALAASKGAGFVVGHPAERLVREAMFFLVWSCPQPVLEAALCDFALSTFD
ncbi:MAG TPA: acyl-CoA dehydrogenase family protein [Planctomycetaceae bacterium]|nr:acyl-CoA dehydrogenase family protein [Planctomycetaceae bacterium]